jgi:pimeloyl-ACP methyl ester carboxylesterase
MKPMQVVVDHLVTRYERKGTGKSILLLHGWGDSLETFHALVAELSKQYECVSLDLPGFGKTDPPADSWDLSNYAQFISAFLTKVSVKPFAVIGHSNGGALAIHGCAGGWLSPKHLVLLAASGVRDQKKLQRLGIKIIAKVGKVLTLWLPRSARQHLQKKLYGTVGSDMLVAPHLEETFKRTVRQDIQVDAARLALPTLLIYGDNDTATPLASIGRRLHDLIPDSQLEVIQGAEHFVHHTATEQVNELIMDFLK